MRMHYPARVRATPAQRASFVRVAAASLLLGAALPAFADETVPPPSAASAPTGARLTMQANDVLMRAISLVGTPYVWGGNTPESGFDCSGLVNYVFRDMLGLRLPRTSRELSVLSAPAIESGRLGTGDLVFFASGGQVTHVGIYVGDGRFVHAPRTGGVVRLERLDGAYWQARYAGARRVLAGG